MNVQYTTATALSINAANGGTIGTLFVDSGDGKLKFYNPSGDLLIASADTETGVITFEAR